MLHQCTAVPGCPELVGRHRPCPIHAEQRRQAKARRDAGYHTPGHKAFRAAVLRRDPICVLCALEAATTADHYPRSRAELVEAGEDPDDPRRGRGLCHRCHMKETARRQPGGWNRR